MTIPINVSNIDKFFIPKLLIETFSQGFFSFLKLNKW